MILLTGAAGKTGLAVLRALHRKGTAVRAWIRRPEQEHQVRQAGAHQVMIGDLLDESPLAQAFLGVQALHHICPNVSPHEVEIGRRILNAAHQARIEHFVFHSVLHPQVESMPHHWRKLRVEEMIVEGSLPFTILQPTAYMQNLLPQLTRMREEGIYTVPYSPKSRISLVDLEEVAEVAAKVLTEEGHQGATYELCGPDFLDQNEVAAIFAEQLGRPVKAERMPLSAWRTQALEDGLDEERCETLIAMFRAYDRYGLRGNCNVLRWLLEREPRSLNAFIEGLPHQPQPNLG